MPAASLQGLRSGGGGTLGKGAPATPARRRCSPLPYLALSEAGVADDKHVRVAAERNGVAVVHEALASAKERQQEPRLDELLACGEEEGSWGLGGSCGGGGRERKKREGGRRGRERERDNTERESRMISINSIKSNQLRRNKTVVAAGANSP